MQPRTHTHTTNKTITTRKRRRKEILLISSFQVMAATKISLQAQAAIFLVLVVALGMQPMVSQAQSPSNSCSSQLTNLQQCAPFVVPGANSLPSTECCGALQSIQSDCLCNTLRVASRLPTQCNLPALNCGN